MKLKGSYYDGGALHEYAPIQVMATNYGSVGAIIYTPTTITTG
jgi:hypothetical protein